MFKKPILKGRFAFNKKPEVKKEETNKNNPLADREKVGRKSKPKMLKAKETYSFGSPVINSRQNEFSPLFPRGSGLHHQRDRF